MKTIYSIFSVILFLLSISIEANAQTAYDYAIKWKKIRPNTDNNDTKSNLGKFKKNPFDSTIDYKTLKTEIDEIDKGKTKQTGAEGDNVGSFLDKIPLSYQSILIDGTAKYVADRFKDEATNLYIKKFRDKLNKAEDFKYILPKTFNYLDKGDLFQYQSLGNTVKQNFEDDLDNILVGMQDFMIYSNLANKLCSDKKPVCNALIFSLDIGNQIKAKTNFVELLSYLETKYNTQDHIEYYRIIHVMRLIEQNIRKDPNATKVKEDLTLPDALENNYKNFWRNKEDLAKLNEPLDWVYFLALIYHQDHKFFSQSISIINGNQINLNSITMTNEDRGVKDLQNYALKIIAMLQNIERIHVQDQVKAEEYVEIFSNLASILKLVNDKNMFIDMKYFDITQSAIDIATSVIKKDYSHVVSGGANLLDNILTSQPDSLKKYKANFIKYGTFMVDITTAKNSDEVKEALKKNVTSFSSVDKRKKGFSITLNADPGIIPFTSLESLDKFENVRSTFAITCPIGFDLGFGGGESYNGLSLSVLDIGAAFSYRLNDSSSELPDKISFKQVFSPGIAFKHGIKKTPLSWALGYQYVPDLRTITPDKIEVTKNASRFFLRFTWDMPIAKLLSNK